MCIAQAGTKPYNFIHRTKNEGAKSENKKEIEK